ncbi:mucin-5AC-like [Bombyx mori]|uniref:mucin-5AC-like n=1 Tax=Bombyx mori TaxID=7091 RepID=UPI002ED4C22D
MSGGASPPIVSTPGPSRKGRQAMDELYARRPIPRTRPVPMDPGKDDSAGPSVSARVSQGIGPGEGSLPLSTDHPGTPRPRKKARSESDRGSSEDHDKRPRLGPSSKSEGEDSEATSSSPSSSQSSTPDSSRSSSPTGSPIPAVKPVPKPRAPVRTGVAPRLLRSPPRSPSPTISPIPVDSTRGAPALSGTAGNLDSTRYMDLESTKAQQPIPSTSYATIAASQPPVGTRPKPTQPQVPPPPRPRGRAQEELRRHPPIMVEALSNWSRHMAAIRERLGRAPSARPHGAGFRFLPSSAEEYRVIQDYLSRASAADKAIKWFCYALSEEIPSKVAVRGLPADTDAAEVTNALKELGFPARYARCIQAKRGRQGCVFFVALDHLSKGDLARLYSVNELLYLPGVTVEGWRPTRGPAQCHRCQAFGHASTNCHRAVRCVRCAGEHIVADCPRPRDGPLSCANCGKDHAATDRRCVVYRKRARMMGVTIPPPVPPVPRPRNVPAPVAAPVSAPIPKGKGKGKGKSSQTPAPLPPSTLPSASVVEAMPSAATLMAQANPPRRTNKPVPTPRGRASSTTTTVSKPAPLTQNIQSTSTVNRKREKNRKKKLNRKLRKMKEKEANTNNPPITTEPVVPDLQTTQAEAMSTTEASHIDQPSTNEGPVLSEAHQSAPPYTSQPPLPPRPQREQRSGRQASQPAGFAAWLLALWEKLSEVISGITREIASGASPFGALLSGFLVVSNLAVPLTLLMSINGGRHS